MTVKLYDISLTQLHAHFNIKSL